MLKAPCSLQVNLAEEIQKAEYPTRNPREAFILTQALFQIGESAWEDYIRSQDGWIARGKRSKDLLGRLFEGMALETRIRRVRARRGTERRADSRYNKADDRPWFGKSSRES